MTGSQRALVEEFFDQIAEEQSGFYTNPNSLAARFQNIVQKTVLGMLRPGTILDVGCGRGRYANLNSRFSYVGIDVSHGMLKVAKKNVDAKQNGDFHFIQASAEFLPVRNQIFDFVICVDMFHHLPTQSVIIRVLREFTLAVKNDGSLIIEIKNKLNAMYMVLSKFNSAPVVRLATYSEIRTILSALGFNHVTAKSVVIPSVALSPLIVIEAHREKLGSEF